MKVLVAVKRVLDHAVRPRVNAESTGVDVSNTKLVMNPFDEIAVEEALRLRERERGVVTKALAITCGPAAELGVDTTQRVRTLRVAEPPRRRAGVRVPDVATLVEKLREAARVI